MSETSKHRSLFLEYCKGDGLDIGYGGDPILDTAICVDLPDMRAHVGNHPQHIHHDAAVLKHFRSNVFSYVFSSHNIEDYTETEKVLREWTRVIEPGGYLCLLFPDEQVYRGKSKIHNVNHKHLDFSLKKVVDVVKRLGLEIILAKELFEGNDYNCALIARKNHLSKG